MSLLALHVHGVIFQRIIRVRPSSRGRDGLNLEGAGFGVSGEVQRNQVFEGGRMTCRGNREQRHHRTTSVKANDWVYRATGHIYIKAKARINHLSTNRINHVVHGVH